MLGSAGVPVSWSSAPAFTASFRVNSRLDNQLSHGALYVESARDARSAGNEERCERACKAAAARMPGARARSKPCHP